MTIFYFRHHPGDGDLTIANPAKALDAADIDILKQTGLRGTLESRGNSASNSTT